MRSVLTNADQDGGRLPDRCVLTGRPTGQAIRLRAVPAWVPERLADIVGAFVRVGRVVTLPVDEPALRHHRRRQLIPLGLAGAGIGLIVLGIVGGYFHLFGAVLGAVAVVLQARNRRRRWVQVRAGAGGSEVIVLRAHEAFDRQARQLYASSLTRRR